MFEPLRQTNFLTFFILIKEKKNILTFEIKRVIIY